MGAAGRHVVLPLLPAFLRKEADAIYHVRSWLNKIGIPDSHIRAEEPPGGGAIRSPDKMDLYLLEERVIIEVKRSGRLFKGPCEKGTGSGGNESAYEQICRYVADERRLWRFYPTVAWAGASGSARSRTAMSGGSGCGRRAGRRAPSQRRAWGGPAPCWRAATRGALPAS